MRQSADKDESSSSISKSNEKTSGEGGTQVGEITKFYQKYQKYKTMLEQMTSAADEESSITISKS